MSKPVVKRSGNFSVVIKVYGIGILFSFNQSPKKLQSILKRKKILNITINPDQHNFPGSTYANGSTTAVIVMRDWPQRASDYNTLQHEIFHAVDLTLRNIGFRLTDESMEAWAYSIGYVSESIYQILWDKKYH